MSPGNIKLTERKARLAANGLAFLGAGIAAVTAGASLLLTAIPNADLPLSLSADRSREMHALEEANAKLRADVAQLQASVAGLSPANQQLPTSRQVLTLQQTVASVVRRQNRLEQAISRDPAKALELPLLRRDLDNLKESQGQSVEAVRQSVAQIYDLNKWLIGGGALSLFAIAVSLILGRWKSGAAD